MTQDESLRSRVVAVAGVVGAAPGSSEVVGPTERAFLYFWAGLVEQVLKGETVEVLGIPRQIVGSPSGKAALRSLGVEVVYLVEEEDSCWAWGVEPRGLGDPA